MQQKPIQKREKMKTYKVEITTTESICNIRTVRVLANNATEARKKAMIEDSEKESSYDTKKYKVLKGKFNRICHNKQYLDNIPRVEAVDYRRRYSGGIYLPIYEAYFFRGKIVFWCPKCKAYHTHSKTSHIIGDIIYRDAHCCQECNEYGGYYLKIVGKI